MSTRARVAAVALAALVALALVALLRDGPAPEPTPNGIVGTELVRVGGRTCPRREGPFGPGRWPSACWRPYSNSSPFNRLLPANPRLAPRSDRIVKRLLGFGPIQHLLAGQAGTKHDGGHPTYWSQPGDPWFTIRCRKRWGRCPLEGVRIQIPDRARPAGGSDGHLTVVDQRSGWEYDMWAVISKPAGGGELVTGWGGRTRTDGDGLGSNGVAGNYGTMAGKLRAEELGAGQIEHALFMFVSCDSGTAVYPAVHGGRPCSALGESNVDAPPMGTRFQLDMSTNEIDALRVPDWKKTILRAMARYGMYVGDTGGTWGIKEEGGLTYTSFGYADRWVQLAKEVGVPYYAASGDWIFNLSDGVDWLHRLRVIDPCEARGTCGQTTKP